jgi:multidrug efflux pump
VREAAVHRLRPILLTALAAILAMIPLTRSTFWGPMAWAIMGGLMVATILTLIVLPALYELVFDRPQHRADSRRFPHETPFPLYRSGHARAARPCDRPHGSMASSGGA